MEQSELQSAFDRDEFERVQRFLDDKKITFEELWTMKLLDHGILTWSFSQLDLPWIGWSLMDESILRGKTSFRKNLWKHLTTWHKIVYLFQFIVKVVINVFLVIPTLLFFGIVILILSFSKRTRY